MSSSSSSSSSSDAPFVLTSTMFTENGFRMHKFLVDRQTVQYNGQAVDAGRGVTYLGLVTDASRLVGTDILPPPPTGENQNIPKGDWVFWIRGSPVNYTQEAKSRVRDKNGAIIPSLTWMGAAVVEEIKHYGRRVQRTGKPTKAGSDYDAMYTKWVDYLIQVKDDAEFICPTEDSPREIRNAGFLTNTADTKGGNNVMSVTPGRVKVTQKTNTGRVTQTMDVTLQCKAMRTIAPGTRIMAYHGHKFQDGIVQMLQARTSRFTRAPGGAVTKNAVEPFVRKEWRFGATRVATFVKSYKIELNAHRSQAIFTATNPRLEYLLDGSATLDAAIVQTSRTNSGRTESALMANRQLALGKKPELPPFRVVLAGAVHPGSNFHEIEGCEAVVSTVMPKTSDLAFEKGDTAAFVERKLYTAITTGLALCDENKLASATIPPLGVETAFGFTTEDWPQRIAHTIARAIYDYVNTHPDTGLRAIYFVNTVVSRKVTVSDLANAAFENQIASMSGSVTSEQPAREPSPAPSSSSAGSHVSSLASLPIPSIRPSDRAGAALRVGDRDVELDELVMEDDVKQKKVEGKQTEVDLSLCSACHQKCDDTEDGDTYGYLCECCNVRVCYRKRCRELNRARMLPKHWEGGKMLICQGDVLCVNALCDVCTPLFPAGWACNAHSAGDGGQVPPHMGRTERRQYGPRESVSPVSDPDDNDDNDNAEEIRGVRPGPACAPPYSDDESDNEPLLLFDYSDDELREDEEYVDDSDEFRQQLLQELEDTLVDKDAEPVAGGDS